MEEREAPPPSEQKDLQENQPVLDPSVYSVGPNASIPEESFDESDDVRSWEGGSTDFTFDEIDEAPVAKLSLPDVEVIAHDEDWLNFESLAINVNQIYLRFTRLSLVGSERIELSIFAMSRQRHKPLDHEP